VLANEFAGIVIDQSDSDTIDGEFLPCVHSQVLARRELVLVIVHFWTEVDGAEVTLV
jgi:hypothetical protein